MDAFAGAGGFRLGIQQALPQAKCVGAIESDRWCCQVYSRQFEKIEPTEIKTIKPSELPDFDLFCGGFPCQAFSIAGRRKGFEDSRGSLFFEIARILAVKRPRYLLLENVKGLLNHEGGKTFSIILETLESLGYDLQWMALNSRFFGVPQNRERVFIIGHCRGESRPKILPFRACNTNDSKETAQQTTNALIASYSHGPSSSMPVIVHQNKSGLIACRPISVALRFGASHNYQALSNAGPLRRLTPRECERLQGFPDDWTIGISDTQRYRMMGNAVTVPVVEQIIQSWFNSPRKIDVDGKQRHPMATQ